MPNFASVTLIGHIGRDPETKTTQGGDTVTSFSVATNRKTKDADVATWWNCTAWGKRGEVIAQWLKKGDPICVQGEPCLRPYTTKDGRDGMSLEVAVQSFTFVGGKGDGQGAAQEQRPAKDRPAAQAPSGGGGAGGAVPFNDDIPFDRYGRGFCYAL